MRDSDCRYDFGPFRLDAGERRLLRDGLPVPLTPKAFDLLHLLVRNSGHLLTKDELMRSLWPDSVVEENNLTVNMSLVRRALGESRNAVGHYIETVPKTGYRFVGPVTKHTSPGPARHDARRPEEKAAGALPVHSVAVLPFVNASGDAEEEYISDGITERVISCLSRLPRLKVMSRSTVFRFKGREELEAREVGLQLRVEAVLTGRVLRVKGRLVVSVELVNVADGTQIWGERFRWNLSDIFSVEESVAHEVSEQFRLGLTSDERRAAAAPHTARADAYHLYLKGRYFWNKRNQEGVRKAVGLFKQAAAVDPGYALAYVGLADAYHSLCGTGAVTPQEGHSLARAAALRALELQPDLAEAHASLGLISLRYDWDWERAERELRRATELNPNYAPAHHWYAVYLASQGHHEESVEESRRALFLDPLSLMINTLLGFHLYVARRYEEASAQFRATLELDSDFIYALTGISESYLREGKIEQAQAQAERACVLAGRDSIHTLTFHAYMCAEVGRVGEARGLLGELLVRAAREFVSYYEIAKLYAALGERDRVFEWLDRAFDQRDGNMIHLHVLPELDRVRADRRYVDLARRMNLIPRRQ